MDWIVQRELVHDVLCRTPTKTGASKSFLEASQGSAVIQRDYGGHLGALRKELLDLRTLIQERQGRFVVCEYSIL